MKSFAKKAAALLCTVLLLASLAGTALAAEVAQLRPDMTILIDGTARTFYAANGQQVHPILYNGTTYLPVRAIGELMGKLVDWNQSTKTVTLSGVRTDGPTAGTPDKNAAVKDVSVDLRRDFTVVVDGVKRSFTDAGGNAVYPLLCNGSTYLPVRAIGELMGASVDWDGETKTVKLETGLVTDADTFSGENTPPAAAGQSITRDEAQTIALARVPGADASHVKKLKLDRDDGRSIYEVEIVYSGMEYEMEIDAASGTVLEFDSESIYD